MVYNFHPSKLESAVMSTTLLVGLTGGVGAAILVLVGLSVILLVVFLLRTNKRHRQNGNNKLLNKLTLLNLYTVF